MWKDELTTLWARVDPATAFAAGYPVDPSWAGPQSESERRALGEEIDRAAGSCSPDEDLMLATLRSLRAQLQSAPLHRSSREAVEWLRALSYRNLLGSPLASAIEGALERRIAALGEACGEAPPLHRLLCAIDLKPLAELARSAGASDLEVVVTRLLDRLDGSSVSGSLEDARRVLTDSHETAVITPQEHRSLLADAFGFEETAEEIEELAGRWLAEELVLVKPLALRVGRHLGLSAEDSADLEKVVSELSRQRQPKDRTTLEEAKRQTRIALPLFQERLVELSPAQQAILPEATPPVMVPLVTEGEEYMVEALGREPKAYCFITEGECGSVYTLANVLYHELAHCWNMWASATEALSLPAPARAGGLYGKILLEGIALHREWEVYALYLESLRSREAWEYASLFDDLGVSRGEAALEFELETRYWRLARFLRALFDARVHGGRQGHLDFLSEQQAATGFAQERIHRFCFHFYASPGYAPCYALGGVKLAALQEESARHGLSVREFNTRVNRMGLVPPAFWRSLLYASPTGKDSVHEH